MKATPTAKTNIFNKRADKVLFSSGKFGWCVCTTKMMFDKVTENKTNKTKAEIAQHSDNKINRVEMWNFLSGRGNFSI